MGDVVTTVAGVGAGDVGFDAAGDGPDDDECGLALSGGDADSERLDDPTGSVVLVSVGCQR